MVVEVFEDCAGAVSIFVARQLDRGAELEQLNILIQHLVLEHPHDFEAGIVRAGQEARLGTAAALLHMEVAVPIAIEQDAQAQEPFRNRRTFLHHHLEQLMVVLHVAALQRVHEVGDGRVFRRDRNLHAALGHHAVGVAEAKLGCQHDLGACRMGMERRSAAGSAAAHDQHIGRVVRRQIESVCDGTVALQQGCQLDRRFVPHIGTEPERTKGALPKIWVILMDQLVAIGRRKLEKGLLASSIPRLVHDLLKRMDVHV